ncbi:S-layer homology domain-containing protein [Desulfallas thermosapovorans]|uniref:Carboxypeptidase family protein n=1 Tax=Desulfallas thermosapovorans DSM 6562 TaxID=1121431 RepID=A0A5S4ZQ57_9FIRM|nr:S-layer homology domain-containing protein [Desulfallas thermosapovorans]TYO93257.1 carboxypeptidase family protein [Desulfallas thermosapovorans DSM 6562]
MFNRRYFLSLLIVLSLMLTAAGYAFAAGFTDTRGHWAEGQINKWAEKGLAGGYSDGTFKPNNQVTRAEFVALVNRAFGIETKGFAANFSDVNSSQWYYNDIAAASAAGYTGGYPDGTFKPQQSISRQEAASILVRLLELEPTTQGLEGFKDAGQIPQWSRSSIGAIAKAGLMAGYPDGTFQPGKSITRAEAVVALDRAREFAPVTPPVIEEATLQGTVTLDGKAVSGATVRVFKAGGYEDIKETETDSKGYFEFALAAGDYDLTAVTDNKVAYQSDITVVKDEKATAKLELVPAAVVSGTLYDENRTKVQNAKMLFTTNPTFIIYTGNDGKFKGAVLPDSTYTVQVYKPGKEDEDPLLLAEDVAVGAAGTRSLGIFKAPFSLSAPGGGGGGGPSGGDDTPVIVSIDNIQYTVALNENYSLPTEVTANMSDGKTKKYSVTWSPNVVDTTKAGVFTFQGTVSGYAPKVILTLRVEAPVGTSVEVDPDIPVAYEGGITIDFTSVKSSLPEGVKVTVKKCDEDDYELPSDPPAVFTVAGQVIEVEFDKQVDDFSAGVKLTLPYDESKVDDPDNLAIFYYNESEKKWECAADPVVDKVNKLVTVTVYHFSKWGVIEAARVEKPTANPQPGEIDKGTKVKLSTATPNAKIYYTTDGKNPNAPKHRILYEAPIVITSDTTIKALAIKDNMKNSHVETFEYNIKPYKPYIESITNGTVDQQNKKIIIDKEPSKFSDLEIELYSPSGNSTLEINLNGSKLGSWDFINGSNDLSLGNSISGFNIATTAAALLGAGLSHQDVLDAVEFSSLFEAIKRSSNFNKDEFYAEVVNEIAIIANNDENISEQGRKAIIEALNIPAINNAADTNTKAKIKDILRPAVEKYNTCAGDNIAVEDLVDDYVNTLDNIAKSECREAFYNAVNITALYETIKSSSKKDAIIDAINEKAIINAITEHAGTTTIAAMAMKVYVYLDELGSDSKKEILNTVNLSQLMINVSEKVGNDLVVIVKDKKNPANQTVYTVDVEK